MAPLGGVHRYPKKNLWQPHEDMKAAFNADSMASIDNSLLVKAQGRKGNHTRMGRSWGRCISSQIIRQVELDLVGRLFESLLLLITVGDVKYD